MDYVIWLDQLGKDDIKTAGGKGANLGEMIRVGIPVPVGFVITTTSFDKFLQEYNLEEKIDRIIKDTNVDNTMALIEASKKVKESILSSDVLPELREKILAAYRRLSDSGGRISLDQEDQIVAVRSSATAEDLPTASFAGQQASFLNVKGEGRLIESVKGCWASLFEPRAIFYRAKHDIARASIALIVQKMIDSDKSGVMFTVDPLSGEDVILIEATWGLGESIVGGEVFPDSYKVTKSGKIVDLRIGSKAKMRLRNHASGSTVEIETPEDKAGARVLDDEEIASLVNYGLTLEKHYGHPQDVEFAIEKGEINIVQTRAITTKGREESTAIKGNPLLIGIGASPGVASGKVRIILSNDDIAKIEKGDIIVTAMTSPDLVPAMSKSAAIITNLGGRTCHAAIVSREMRIPAIVGTQQATKMLKDGQEVTVDAYSGVIYQGRIEIAPTGAAINIRTGATRTKIKVNLVFARDLAEIAPKTDGVGLLRIEHMITKQGVHPAKLVREGRQEEYIEMLMREIRPIAKEFNPKPVWVRTLDARSDEFRNLKGGEDEPQEANPMLGWHGIRRSLDEPELLKTEFKAIKRLHEEGLTNVHVMLPFVISVEEVKKAKEIARKIGLGENVGIGIMVETPAAVLIIEDLCKEGVAFASFGTNDLTQLTLGIDRNNEKLASMSSEFHPAVLRSMKLAIDVCNRYGVESSICGESGSDPEMVKMLIGYGIKSVSCNADAIDAIRLAAHEQEERLGLSPLQGSSDKDLP
jgi:pyruvate,water dikinase